MAAISSIFAFILMIKKGVEKQKNGHFIGFFDIIII